MSPLSAALRRPGSMVVACVVAVVAAATIVMTAAGSAADWPRAPYDHPGLAESSVAMDDVTAGQSVVVVRGLRALGYWCVQPRRNDVAVQIACRSADRQTSVDIEAAPNGDVLYADIDLPRSGSVDSGAEPQDRGLSAVLEASFLLLWPQERAVVEGLLQAPRPSSFLGKGPVAPSDPDRQYATHEKRTDDADWSLWSFYTGTPLALRLRTAGLKDRSWPFDGSHYATSLSTATDRLSVDGFGCATACFRASDNQTVTFDAHDDQIVSVRFTLRTRTDDDRIDDPAGAWVRAGLPVPDPGRTHRAGPTDRAVPPRESGLARRGRRHPARHRRRRRLVVDAGRPSGPGPVRRHRRTAIDRRVTRHPADQADELHPIGYLYAPSYIVAECPKY